MYRIENSTVKAIVLCGYFYIFGLQNQVPKHCVEIVLTHFWIFSEFHDGVDHCSGTGSTFCQNLVFREKLLFCLNELAQYTCQIFDDNNF